MSSNLAIRRPTRGKNTLLKVSKQQKHRKKSTKPKPAWDGTTKDLTVFKPSPQDLQRNHELHLPKKDHERLQYKSLYSRDLSYLQDSICVGDTTPNMVIEKKKAMIKEVFYKQEKELQSVLAETDHTIANMKDLFGDDVQKYKGKPFITKAPEFKQHSNSFMHDVDPDKPTRYEMLSASVMRTSALNSISSNDEDSSENESESDQLKDRNTEANSYQTMLNLNRYKQLVSEDSNHLNHQERPPLTNNLSDMNTYSQFVNDIHNVLDEQEKQTSKSRVNHQEFYKSPASNEPTLKDQHRKKKKTKETNVVNNSVNSTTQLQSLDNMKQMLDVLDNEITSYETESGKENIIKKYEVPNTLTGYTSRLLSTIVRITHHLKQSEIQLRNEMSMRKEILDAFDEQRSVIDILTNDLVETQEANEELKEELDLHKKTSSLQFSHLKTEMIELRNTVHALAYNASHIHTSQTNTSHMNTSHMNNKLLGEENMKSQRTFQDITNMVDPRTHR